MFHLKGGRKVALFIGRERACGLNCRDVPAMVVTRCGPAGAVPSWPPMNRAITTRQRRNDLAELFPDIEWEHPRPRRHGVPLFRWIGQHDWPAQAVLWLFVVTGVYLLSVFGLALGVALGMAFEVWLA